MTRLKNVTTNRVWLREDFHDKLDRYDQELKLTAFVRSTPNGTAIGQYLRHERKAASESQSHEPEYRFFYDADSRKADYLAVWTGMQKYPTAIRHTVENLTADEAKTIDALTASALRTSAAQFGWAVAELQIESHVELDSAA